MAVFQKFILIWILFTIVKQQQPNQTAVQLQSAAERHINVFNVEQDLEERIALMKSAYVSCIAVFINSFKRKIKTVYKILNFCKIVFDMQSVLFMKEL